MTLRELRQSVLVEGPPDRKETWDRNWRTVLIDNLGVLTNQLWLAGITEIFIDGSFVEEKDHPNDIDGYFVCNSYEFLTGQVEAKLNSVSRDAIWTWNPQRMVLDQGTMKRRLPMWMAYRVELFPEWGQFSNIRDQFGNNQKFPAAFRVSRHQNTPKGIVKIVHSHAGGNKT